MEQTPVAYVLCSLDTLVWLVGPFSDWTIAEDWITGSDDPDPFEGDLRVVMMSPIQAAAPLALFSPDRVLAEIARDLVDPPAGARPAEPLSAAAPPEPGTERALERAFSALDGALAPGQIAVAAVVNVEKGRNANILVLGSHPPSALGHSLAAIAILDTASAKMTECGCQICRAAQDALAVLAAAFRKETHTCH